MDFSRILCLILLGFLTFYSTTASGNENETYSSSWPDLNWSACEGLGVLGSGKVAINASYVETDDTILVKRLSV